MGSVILFVRKLVKAINVQIVHGWGPFFDIMKSRMIFKKKLFLLAGATPKYDFAGSHCALK